jgi:colanic acid biosynthesis glycosyl transferase WcaI
MSDLDTRSQIQDSKMKLLLVVANFVPEIGSAAHIYFDLARAFAKKGHEVHIITSYPREFNLSQADRGRDFPLEETIEGVHVHRCRHTALRDNMVMRGMEHFLLPIYYFRAFQKLGMRFDASLIYIPPLPLYYFARAIKRYNGTPSVLNYQDFHPQELTDVGLLKNPILIKIMEYIEGQSYKKADYITVLSNGGIDYVASRGGDRSRIAHIYNGCDLSELNGAVKKDFKKKVGIEDKVLITYAGILSPFQGLDKILDAVKGLRDHQDLIFYIVGDGLIKEHLARRISEEQISNVRLLPLQPRDEYLNIVGSSDISLVSLDERMKAPCLPGKLVNLMALGQPIIAIVPEESETARLIQESMNGFSLRPGDSQMLKHIILKLSLDVKPLKRLGHNGEIFLRKNMSLSDVTEKYENILKSIN